MSPAQLNKRLEQARRKMLIYRHEWPLKAGGVALKFIDSNFTSQGWQGNTLIPWRRTKSGKTNLFGQKSQGILENRGILRGSFRLQGMKEEFRIYTRNKYARVHNEGFKGTVKIPEHVRKIKMMGSVGGFQIGEHYSIKTKKKLKNKRVTTKVTVKAHSRFMNIPMRQFMPNRLRPESTILNNQIRKMTMFDIERILQIAR